VLRRYHFSVGKQKRSQEGNAYIIGGEVLKLVQSWIETKPDIGYKNYVSS